MSRIAKCGRAVAFLQGGIVRFVRDEAKTIPVALFSPRNIVKNSLSIQYIMPSEDTADSVTIEYFSNKTWKTTEITGILPESTSENTATVELFGCTDKDQALREALYMAAANRYRRRIVSFMTELDGLIPTYGDLVAITHDMPSWGKGGEIVSRDGNKLSLSEPVILIARLLIILHFARPTDNCQDRIPWLPEIWKMKSFWKKTLILRFIPELLVNGRILLSVRQTNGQSGPE